MTKSTIRVAIDVGSKSHWVGVGLSEGQVLERFSIAHNQKGFEHFFRRVELHRQRLERPVEVAMEGYNGWARPLDQQIQQRGYRLLNVNNLKLARFKEIFPAPAKNDHIDTDKMLELFQLGDTLARAKNVIQEVKPVPEENRQLKRLTRRRRQLVVEKVRLGNRLKADLQAVCPELADLTGSIDNRWFLSFMTARLCQERDPGGQAGPGRKPTAETIDTTAPAVGGREGALGQSLEGRPAGGLSRVRI